MIRPINSLSTCQFETQRLSVLHWGRIAPTGQVSKALHTQLTSMLTPKVLAFLPDAMQLDSNVTGLDKWLNARKTESELLVIQDKQTTALIGLLILTDFEEDGNIEIRLGYLLAEQHWGKGYATELLQGLVKWSRGRNYPLTLLGGVEKNNTASAKALRKAGFIAVPKLSTQMTDTYQLSVGF